ncbi:MAG: pyridoxamine 5'-phosphate oxidase family protein [Pseudomonadota bacterium]
MAVLTSQAALDAIYDAAPSAASTEKVATALTPAYRAWIEAAPFCALATVGPEGLDCSPRGDIGHVVHVVSDAELALPDRRGNNRIDSLRNIVRDPRVALMFLIPGSGTVIRVNGRAEIRDDAALLAQYPQNGKLPRTVTLIRIGEVYFQCARAIHRADIWNTRPALSDLPTTGQILASMTKGAIDAKDYDDNWTARAAKTMW